MTLALVLLCSMAALSQAPAIPFAGTVIRLNTPPADWVAEGGGLLAFGSEVLVNLSTPEAPAKVLASFSLDAPVTSAALAGSYAYLAQEGLGLRVMDLNIPSRPADLGLIPVSGDRLRVALVDGRLLVATRGRLSIMELNHSICPDNSLGVCMGPADPFDMAEVASVSLDGLVLAMSSWDGKVILAMDAGPLEVVDLSAPGPPVAMKPLGESLPAVALAAFSRGLVVGFPGTVSESVRVVPGRSPFEVWGAEGLVAQGRILFVASGDQGLYEVRDVTPIEATVSVAVGNFFFSPSNVNLSQGDRVHWTWVGGTHTSTSGACPGGNCLPNGIWDSGTKTGGTFDFTFNDAGNFPYFCEVHGASMTGRVAVASVGPTPLSATASANPSVGPAPLVVAFTGTALGGTPPYVYAWSFGDGTVDPSEKDPPHAYIQAGNYSAVLTVTDAASGAVQAAPVTIAVVDPSSNPPVISAIKKTAPPFAIVITGSNLQNGIRVFINEMEWAGVGWKNPGKIKLGGGKALKAAVPKGTGTVVRLLNPDGGSVTQTFTW
jgi:plastocyanin